MKHLFFLLLITVLALPACQPAHSDSTQGADAGALYLNNGQKWPVNADMLPHIRQAGTLIGQYQTTGDGDYARLAAELQATHEKLIASCTMKGESHDVLHLWLHPHMKLTNDLARAQSTEEAQALVDRLAASMQTFQQYFE